MRWAEAGIGGRADRTTRGGAWAATLLVALPLLLTACGGQAQSESTATEPAAGTPSASPAPGDSPAAAGQPRTLGELADRVNAAWAGVGSFRSVFDTIQPGATSSPAAGSPAPTGAPLTLVREVALPDRQRLEQRAGDATVSEAVVVENRVYVRGAAAQVLLPGADPSVWVEGDLAAVAPLAGADPLLTRLVAPIESPLAATPDNLRPQELRPLGPVDVAGRACQAYGAASTTEIGTRIDITIAVAPDGLPCFVETRAGGAGGRETFEGFGQPLAIEPPTQTTAAAPAAAPATPAGRD